MTVAAPQRSSAAQPYRLLRTPPQPVVVPTLDPAQRAVVDHRGGPLLVLAGPGTGKTTTLVEAVAARVAGGTPLDRILVLTFGRRAALELRRRITARLQATVAAPAAWTFHSFCYALVRAWSDAEAWPSPPRLLSGPEQDVAIRELLRGALADGRSQWPPELAPAVPTRGFAEEVSALLARVREAGLDPAALADLGHRAGRPAWVAAARFHAEYLDVLDAQGALDYPELVRRAATLAERPELRADLRGRFDVVFVDEYQDTDPGQEALLQALAGGGRELVVVGDPDQSIYAFRGADVRGILRFPDRFPCRDGAPAPVLALRESRRAGRRLLHASRSIATRLPIPGVPAAISAAHRELRPAAGVDDGRVEARVYPTARAEHASIADLLRRAHLEDGVPWSEMAVLVRSGTRSIPQLRRALSSAGVPVEVAGDELPLAQEPAVAPLLLALRVVSDGVDTVSADQARDLLLSPLGGADAADLRRLGRALRALARAGASVTDPAGPRAPADAPEPAGLRPSADLVRDAVVEPDRLLLVDDRVARPARRLGDLLRSAAATLTSGGTPYETLWALWDGSDWPRRLQRAAAGGGPAGRSADRDLDAVLALFQALDRAEERRGRRGLANVLAEIEAQQIPGDTLAERPARTAGARVLTAHRAKGLEWDLVVVAGVQEGAWPDLRRRGSILESDRIGADELRDPPDAAALLVDERRLFYVACTRARRRLIVTAVAGADDDGDRPSRFLDELGVTTQVVTTRPQRPLSLTGLVAELRRTATDPAVRLELRRAATDRLAWLATRRRADGRAMVPAAHPATWWGVAGETTRSAPIVAPDAPVRLSGTSLSGIETCPARWFFEHEARATTPASAAMGFGGLLHTLADDVARGVAPPDVGTLLARLDRVWSLLAYDAPWESTQQRDEARAALERFCLWHAADRGRRTVATEVPFEATVSAGGREVVLTGRIDRVEVDRDGRVHVVDFKTGKNPPAAGDLPRHPQLGVYQLAVRSGALHGVDGVGDPPVTGGAELVHLRCGVKDGGPKTQTQAPLESDDDGTTWIERLLADAVARIVGESFPATPSDACDRCAYQRCCPAQPAGRRVVE